MFDNCPAFSLEEYAARDGRVSDSVPACQQIWSKKLADGGSAVVFVNFDTNAASMTCDASCMAKIGFTSVSGRTKKGVDAADTAKATKLLVLVMVLVLLVLLLVLIVITHCLLWSGQRPRPVGPQGPWCHVDVEGCTGWQRPVRHLQADVGVAATVTSDCRDRQDIPLCSFPFFLQSRNPRVSWTTTASK